IADAALRSALAEHVWLQWRHDGAWVDLDPTLAAAAPGRTRCAVASTSEVLPDSAVHRLQLRVAEETLDGGALQTRTVLEHTLRTVDLVDAGPSVMIAESIGLGARVPERAPPPDGFLAYTPLLRVDTVAGPVEVVGDSVALPAPIST